MNLPDLVFEQLRHLLDMGEMNQWAVGDFIRDVWTEVAHHVPTGDAQREHSKMITQMATRTGADRSTLYSREKMSGFYPKSVREAWQPPYTYHHLRALMAAEDDWEVVAQWGLTGGYNDGLATVQEIRDHIKGEEDPTALTVKRLQRLDKLARKIIEAEETPEDVSEALILVPLIVSDALDIL